MPKSFQRDRFFWVAAVQTAIINFYLGGFGPAQSLLRADQGTSLTIAGLHGTAMGVASIASSKLIVPTTFERIAGSVTKAVV